MSELAAHMSACDKVKLVSVLNQTRYIAICICIHMCTHNLGPVCTAVHSYTCITFMYA